MNNRDMIIQHNDLISGRHNWSTNEIKIVLKLITQISENQDIYKFSFSDIVNLLGEENNKISSVYLKSIANNLMDKKFEIIKEKDSWRILHWFREIQYEKGIMSIKVEDMILPYLTNLKKNFTKYNIQNIIHMKSNYSMRIYQLLKQYQRIGSRKFMVNELRDLLKVPESYKYSSFKLQVILKAQQEMEEYSDLTFTFEEIKTGRKITEIKFNIKRKENNKHIKIEDKEENPWYFDKYYGRNVLQSDINYENITEIKDSEKYLTIIFEDGDTIKVKDEDALIKILID